MDLLAKYLDLAQKLRSASGNTASQNELQSVLNEFENLLAEYITVSEEKYSKYKNLYENASASIFIHTREGNILEANSTACDYYQFCNDEWIGMTIFDLEASEQTFREKIGLISDKAYISFESLHRRKDGSTFFAEVSSKKIKWNGREAVMSFSRDITQRKKAEQELKESEIKFREIIQQTNDGIVVFNEHKEIVIWNKGAENLFGIGAEEKLNTSIVDQQFEFAPVHLKNREMIDRTISGLINFQIPELFNKPMEDEVLDPVSGKIKTIESILFPIELPGYNLFGAIFRDVSDRVKYEKQLVQINASKDRFIQVLAHDLRNPFNALLGFTELLLNNLSKYDMTVIEHQLNIQKKIIQNTYELLENLLLWSKSQLGMLKFEPQEIVLRELCDETINSLKGIAAVKNVSVIFFEPDKTVFTGDLDMLRIVMNNLLTNAIKFSKPGGRIKIYPEEKDHFLIITVSDKGIGMSDEARAKLWNPAMPFSTKGTGEEKGTGLGLLICKDLVEMHQGYIWAESKPGKGSDFKIALPLMPVKNGGHTAMDAGMPPL
jgi:PAS domain S-box-containing protein